MTVLQVVVFCMGISAAAGVYLYFPSPVTKDVAVSKCEEYGMTLLEPRSQDALNLWNSVKGSLFSMQDQKKTYEPWIGLTHDGSRSSDKSHFRWRDAGAVDFLSWPEGEPDFLGTERCVRIRNNKFGTKSCKDTFSTVCQPPNSLSVTGSRLPFKRDDQQSSVSKHTYKKVNVSAYAESDWLLAVSLPDVHDVDNCVLACHVRSNCPIADAEDLSPCIVFVKVDPPSSK